MFDVKAVSKVRSLYGHYLLVLSQHNSSSQCLCRDTMAESSNKSHLSTLMSHLSLVSAKVSNSHLINLTQHLQSSSFASLPLVTPYLLCFVSRFRAFLLALLDKNLKLVLVPIS